MSNETNRNEQPKIDWEVRQKMFDRQIREEENAYYIKKIAKFIWRFLKWYYPINFVWSIAAGSRFSFKFKSLLDVIDTWINWQYANIVDGIYPIKELSYYEPLPFDYIISPILPFFALCRNLFVIGFAILLFGGALLSFLKALRGKNSGMFGL